MGRWRRADLLLLVPFGLRFLLLLAAAQLTLGHDKSSGATKVKSTPKKIPRDEILGTTWGQAAIGGTRPTMPHRYPASTCLREGGIVCVCNDDLACLLPAPIALAKFD